MFKSNITFAIIKTGNTWQHDLTEKYCQWHAFKFHFEHLTNCANESVDTGQFVKEVETVDQALADCQTDYLVVMTSGFIPFNNEFFDSLEKQLQTHQNLFISNLKLQDDYVIVDNSCIVVNVALWRTLMQPGFESGKLKHGPKFNVDETSKGVLSPSVLTKSESVDLDFIDSDIRGCGTDLIIRQLETFGKVDTLQSTCPPLSYHVLLDNSALQEILSETKFERDYLAAKPLQLVENTESYRLETPNTDILCVPAIGMLPYRLASQLSAKKLIVYSDSKKMLDIQKQILEAKASTIYGQILTDADVFEDVGITAFSPIIPQKWEVEYCLVDCLSIGLFDIVRNLPRNGTVVFDFSDIFVNPVYSYRRPSYQVQGLFNEVYSRLRARMSPTFILGFAPGLKKMDSFAINTMKLSMLLDPEIQKFEHCEPQQVKQELVHKNSLVDKIKAAVGIVNKQDVFQVAEQNGFVRKKASAKIRGTERNVDNLSKRISHGKHFFIVDYFYDTSDEAWSIRISMIGETRKINLPGGIGESALVAHIEQKTATETDFYKLFGIRNF